MIYIFVGSSGSGKSKIGKEYFGDTKEVTSFTTRQKRNGEVNHLDYIFLTKKEAETLLKNNDGDIVEYSTYHGNYYGTLKSELERQMVEDCFMVLDIHGYRKIKSLYPNDAIGIFVEVSKDTLEQRLINRGESHNFVKERLDLFNQEQENKKEMDLVLNNENSIEDTLKTLNKYIKMVDNTKNIKKI